jgi:hypothetical protein
MFKKLSIIQIICFIGVIKTFEKKQDLSKPVFCRVIKPLVPKDSQDT